MAGTIEAISCWHLRIWAQLLIMLMMMMMIATAANIYWGCTICWVMDNIFFNLYVHLIVRYPYYLNFIDVEIESESLKVTHLRGVIWTLKSYDITQLWYKQNRLTSKPVVLTTPPYCLNSWQRCQQDHALTYNSVIDLWSIIWVSLLEFIQSYFREMVLVWQSGFPAYSRLEAVNLQMREWFL